MLAMKAHFEIPATLVRTLLRFSVSISFLGSAVLGPIAGSTVLTSRPSQIPSQAPVSKLAQRTSYEIDLTIDFDTRSYIGWEKVRWVNRSERPISVLYFHLYSNLRVDRQFAPIPPSDATAKQEIDEPRIEVTKVKAVDTDLPLSFSHDDQGTTLRINLRDAVPAGGSTEVAIFFRGNVPEIDPEETGITTHVMKQVSAAIRGDREMRRARDINFRCRGVMMLGSVYPVLAVHDGDQWRRKIEPSVGDMIFNEAANYRVSVSTPTDVQVFTSAPERVTQTPEGEQSTFTANDLRHFAIVAGRGLRSEQTVVGNTTLRSVFLTEHEAVGKRVLAAGANALRLFSQRFGPLPLDTMTITEAPLVAGLGSTEFAGLNVIASAFYVDFDSAAMRNLPELIREQRSSVEQSLEWTVGYLVAQQWWGVAVGNDPGRQAVLDEALSCWSAQLYYKEMYGSQQAATVLNDQLLGVYRLYRTFGGEDMDANRPSREYLNSFQYTAIVTTKGAMMFMDLERLLGEERFFSALRNYYKANLFEVADLDDLRGAFIAEAPIEKRRVVTRTFNRWLESKRGDIDIAPPDPQLAASLGLPTKSEQGKSAERNALNAIGRVGKFFWQQVTRIR